jgi:predicted dehydrogenase
VVLTYPPSAASADTVVRLSRTPTATSAPSRPVVGVIGAGAFARQVLLPAITAADAEVRAVVSAGGVTSLHAGRKFEAGEATTDYHRVLADETINTVFVATRHDAHPRMVCEALAAGKHVFVEKPLAIDAGGLELVRRAHAEQPRQQLMVGFNRRFAPHAVAARRLLAGRSEPLALQIMVNAGEVPSGHWVDDPAVGGGRVIGEACHFIDLALFLTGSAITSVHAVEMNPTNRRGDTLSIQLAFADGSIASVQYWANGPRSYPKERVEIFSAGRVLVIDNWRALRSYDWPGAPRMRLRQDKGHHAQVAQFLQRVTVGGEPVIPFDELATGATATFAALQSAREGRAIRLEMAHPEQHAVGPAPSPARRAEHA